ncbi:nuclear transport factor 2 family protein [Bifidobacterium sp. ESL0798]|uniref:nuclear transport factor 2 family protein n=1 Tax=unclassified Bifidobacterium TaxID=2608897 RepID=UPI0023F63DAE|nr:MULTISPECIES: nuclear transport factor 2 family protein [unclassified Bifidobacterium]WEV52442.1 nuclear transport factor 2 family protein [Bifidobacterium sp. ESL0704]WEV74586.1 nuclear transport factor 2 family protein [Bifidobacterium sp. ESL0798]
MATVTLSIPRARKRERAVSDYFNMWVTRDFDKLDAYFAPDCVYEESNGHIYENRSQIHRWIEDSMEHQAVSMWKIANFTHARGREGQPSITVFWTFAARKSGGESEDFDGVSVIEFNRQNKIKRVREFRAKRRRDYPYRDE